VGDAAILFNQSDPADLAKALASVLSDNDLRQKLISAGQKRIVNYSWTKCAEETLGFIKSLV